MTREAPYRAADIEICFVCTGNRCRSPYAAHYLGKLLADLPVTLTSVGTSGAPDQPVPDELLRLAARRDLDLGDHRSRLISPEIKEADLVLGFERAHLAIAVVESGAAAEKTFTFAEFARLLPEVIGSATGSSWPDLFRDAVAQTHAARKNDMSFLPGEDVEDPFGKGEREYRRMAKHVDRLCEQAARSLHTLGR